MRSISANDLGTRFLYNELPKSLARIERETVYALCTAILDEIKIKEQNKSIATGPL